MEYYWHKRPTLMHEWKEPIDEIMAIDENGTNDLKSLMKKRRTDFFKFLSDDNIIDINNRFFTSTGIIMAREHYPNFRESVVSLKETYWDNGCYQYDGLEKRVVFHSREIRKKEGPFSPQVVDNQNLMNDITHLIDSAPFTIISSSIDKLAHVRAYINPFPVYNLCLDFIIERFCRKLKNENKSGAIILESRGEKEDKRLLKHIITLIKQGNFYHGPEMFDCITGVYFNPKWSEKHKNKKSYPLLEMADLISYPIYKYVVRGNKDKAYTAIEKKLLNYPFEKGYGLKIFPKK